MSPYTVIIIHLVVMIGCVNGRRSRRQESSLEPGVPSQGLSGEISTSTAVPCWRPICKIPRYICCSKAAYRIITPAQEAAKRLGDYIELLHKCYDKVFQANTTAAVINTPGYVGDWNETTVVSKVYTALMGYCFYAVRYGVEAANRVSAAKTEAKDAFDICCANQTSGTCGCEGAYVDIDEMKSLNESINNHAELLTESSNAIQEATVDWLLKCMNTVTTSVSDAASHCAKATEYVEFARDKATAARNPLRLAVDAAETFHANMSDCCTPSKPVNFYYPFNVQNPSEGV